MASDLVLHCLPMSHKKNSRLKSLMLRTSDPSRFLMECTFYLQDEDLSLMHDRLNQANGYYGSPSKPELSYYSNSIPTWSTDTDNLGDRLDSSDKDELSDKRALEHQFFGSRGKRFGLSLFMPTRYSRRFSRYNTQSNPRKRYHPKMFVSMRGKRLDDSKFADSDGDYLGMSDGKYLYILNCIFDEPTKRS